MSKPTTDEMLPISNATNNEELSMRKPTNDEAPAINNTTNNYQTNEAIDMSSVDYDKIPTMNTTKDEVLTMINYTPTSSTAARGVAPDVDTMSRFLSALGEEHTFQVFGEGETEGKGAEVFHGSFEKMRGRLLKANKDKAVYVTVSATDGQGRKKENIIAPRALFLDFDGVEPDSAALDKLPKPSAVVRSGNGKHLYWFLKEGEPLEVLEPALTRLIDYLGADPACKDMGRVMRIPGSVHRKGEPFLTSLLSLDGEARYTIAEVLANVPAKGATKLSKTGRVITPENFYEEIRRYSKKEQPTIIYQAMEDCLEGYRNRLLFVAAIAIYQLSTEGTRDASRASLVQAALVSGLGEAEINSTINSGFSKAAEVPKKLTKEQVIWQNFENLYGERIVFDERTREIKVDGKPIVVEQERYTYIEEVGTSITEGTFITELLTWVKARRSTEPFKAYLEELPEMGTAEAWQVFERLAEEMGVTDAFQKVAIIRHRIGMVARTYEPGCSMQWALGLVGDAGCGKSSYFENYADSTYYYPVGAGLVSDKSVDKDIQLAMSSAVVVDIDEIDTLYGANSFNRLKSIISQNAVKVREPYARQSVHLPRRFVMGFTSNEETPLHDDGAGNRRYAVVKMTGTQTDGRRRMKFYKDHRDLINAAAKALYLAGEPWDFTEVEQVAQARQLEGSINRSYGYALACTGLPILGEFCIENRVGFHRDQLYSLFAPAHRDLYKAERNDIDKVLKEQGWESPQRRYPEGGKQRLCYPSKSDAERLTGMASNEQVEQLRVRLAKGDGSGKRGWREGDIF